MSSLKLSKMCRPGCTLISDVYISLNIDHCLQWAVFMIFEELFESVPAQVNGFLSRPSEFAAAARVAGDAVAKTCLERVLECLDRERCETFQYCIASSLTKFGDFFAFKVKDFTSNYSEDAVTNTGVPFWSPPKRFHRPLQFSSSDGSHLYYIMSSSILRG